MWNPLLEDPRIDVYEHEVLLPDGRIGWQQWVDHVLVDGHGRVVEIQGHWTGRHRAEAKRKTHLRRNESRLTCQLSRDSGSLAGRLIAAQEAERRRIARELHDDLSQKLALLNIDIELLEPRIRNFTWRDVRPHPRSLRPRR